MKRIERNTYNSIKRNTTADTINVEIPVDYSHEARQAIHEYLTINGMRVTGINWNSLQECYCIHWEPARTETAEAIRRQQENADIDDVTKGMKYSDLTWNGYRKPAEAPQEAPAAEAEQQPTETENAPQAATQAAEWTDEKKEAETMTTAEREALERINARQNAANLFTNIGPADIAAELDAMEAEQAAPAPDPDAATLATADAAQVWTEDGKTIATATEAATVAGIIRKQGGYRERIILLAPHEMTHGETWNAAHKVVYVTETTPGPDGYCAGCAVDIVTRAIVG